MFLGQLLVDPTNVQQYVAKHGEELDESAGLFQRATAYKLAVAKGKAKSLDDEIQGLMSWHDEKVAQLNSMGKPKGPGGVRDQLNVQSQILYTEQEINRKMNERDAIIATSEVYGPGALQVEYRGPESRRQVELISKQEITGKQFNLMEKAASIAANQAPMVGMLFPGIMPSAQNSILSSAFDNPESTTATTVKSIEYAARSAAAAASFGTSEALLMLGVDLFGQKRGFSGEGVKGFITDAGRSFSDEQASVAMTSKLQQGVQAVYSSAIGNTPILTKVAPKNSAAQIKNVGVDISPAGGGVVQSKAVYGGLAGVGERLETPSWWPFIGSVAFAWWMLYEVAKK